MLGTVGQMETRTGGFSIVYKIDNKLSVKVPAGSKILCTECEIENESTLISDGSILKTDLGYNVQKKSELVITKANTVPLTILHGREIFYIDGAESGTSIKFNLPKGARVNQTIVTTTGEFAVATSNKYLIEY